MSKGRIQQEFRCNDLNVRGDIRITFFDHEETPAVDEKMFYFWFHTGEQLASDILREGGSEVLGAKSVHNACADLTMPGFIEDNHLLLNKNDIDGACRDTGGRVYEDDFRIELIFKPVEHGRVQ